MGPAHVFIPVLQHVIPDRPAEGDPGAEQVEGIVHGDVPLGGVGRQHGPEEVPVGDEGVLGLARDEDDTAAGGLDGLRQERVGGVGGEDPRGGGAGDQVGVRPLPQVEVVEEVNEVVGVGGAQGVSPVTGRVAAAVDDGEHQGLEPGSAGLGDGGEEYVVGASHEVIPRRQRRRYPGLLHPEPLVPTQVCTGSVLREG